MANQQAITIFDTSGLIDLANQEHIYSSRDRIKHLDIGFLLAEAGYCNSIGVDAILWEATGKIEDYQEDLTDLDHTYSKSGFYKQLSGYFKRGKYINLDGNRKYPDHYEGDNDHLVILESGSSRFGKVLELVVAQKTKDISRGEFLIQINNLHGSHLGEIAIKDVIGKLRLGASVYVIIDEKDELDSIPELTTADGYSVGALTSAAYFEAAKKVPSVFTKFERHSKVMYDTEGRGISVISRPGKIGIGAGISFGEFLHNKLLESDRQTYGEKMLRAMKGGALGLA